MVCFSKHYKYTRKVLGGPAEKRGRTWIRANPSQIKNARKHKKKKWRDKNSTSIKLFTCVPGKVKLKKWQQNGHGVTISHHDRPSEGETLELELLFPSGGVAMTLALSFSRLAVEELAAREEIGACTRDKTSAEREKGEAVWFQSTRVHKTKEHVDNHWHIIASRLRNDRSEQEA